MSTEQTSPSEAKAKPSEGKSADGGKYEFWDMCLKTAGGAVVVLGLLFTYLEYRSKENERKEQADRERKAAEKLREQDEEHRRAEATQRRKEYLLRLYEE